MASQKYAWRVAALVRVDIPARGQLECDLFFSPDVFQGIDGFFSEKELAMSLVKIIVITVALILSILLFGRFLF